MYHGNKKCENCTKFRDCKKNTKYFLNVCMSPAAFYARVLEKAQIMSNDKVVLFLIKKSMLNLKQCCKMSVREFFGQGL